MPVQAENHLNANDDSRDSPERKRVTFWLLFAAFVECRERERGERESARVPTTSAPSYTRLSGPIGATTSDNDDVHSTC